MSGDSNVGILMSLREGLHVTTQLSEFPLNIIQVCASQMTVRYSVGFLVFCSASHEQNEDRQDGKTSEMRRNGRRWRKPMAQFGEKVLFR